MLQVLAFRRPCIATSLAGDQRRRVRHFARSGLVVAAPMDEKSLSQALVDLMHDDALRDSMVQRISNDGISDGVPKLIEALGRLRNDTTPVQ